MQARHAPGSPKVQDDDSAPIVLQVLAIPRESLQCENRWLLLSFDPFGLHLRGKPSAEKQEQEREKRQSAMRDRATCRSPSKFRRGHHSSLAPRPVRSARLVGGKGRIYRAGASQTAFSIFVKFQRAQRLAVKLPSGLVELFLTWEKLRLRFVAVPAGVVQSVVCLLSTAVTRDVWDDWVGGDAPLKRTSQSLPIRQSEINQIKTLTPMVILLLAVPLWEDHPSLINPILRSG